MAKLDETKLNETIGTNIKTLLKVTKKSQSYLADTLGIATGAVNGYLSGKTGLRVATLAQLASAEPFDKYGLELDAFLLDNEEFETLVDSSVIDDKKVESYIHKDISGCYLVYLFDQSKELVSTGADATRTLRYGVITIYEKQKYDLYGKNIFKALGKFFKDKSEAETFHKKISGIYKSSQEKNIGMLEYANQLLNEYEGKDDRDKKEFYEGEVDFQKDHIYFDLISPYFGDHALFALYTTPKKENSEYIGGVASLSSVSHGVNRAPCAQKALISRYCLNCAEERIHEIIRMHPVNVDMHDVAKKMYELFENISELGDNSLLDDNDKITIFANRFERLIQSYIEKNLYSVGVVTKEDDINAYRLIQHNISRK